MELRELYCFLLGLSAGVALLATTSYRRVSPTWLKWSLLASGTLLMAHYLTLALFTSPTPPQHLWALRFLWHLMPITLLFPAVMAIDQVLRHPAMSPTTLLKWLAPFLVADILMIVLAQSTVIPHPITSWMLSMDRGFVILSTLLHEAILVTVISVCLLVIRKPLPHLMRQALGVLALGCTVLGLALTLVAARAWDRIPLLISELLMLLALWHAYEAGAELQRSGS